MSPHLKQAIFLNNIICRFHWNINININIASCEISVASVPLPVRDPSLILLSEIERWLGEDSREGVRENRGGEWGRRIEGIVEENRGESGAG